MPDSSLPRKTDTSSRKKSRRRLELKRMAIARCTSKEAAKVLGNKLFSPKGQTKQRNVKWEDELREDWK
jgi:hypothetical protein